MPSQNFIRSRNLGLLPTQMRGRTNRNLNSLFGRENSLFFAIWMKNKRSPFGEANRVRKKDSRAIIAADVRRFGHVINKDGVLGTHNVGSVRTAAFPHRSLNKDAPIYRAIQHAGRIYPRPS